MKAFAVANFAAAAARTWFGRLPAPYKLTFSVTERCNLRCRTCNIWQKRPRDELSFEEIDRFFLENPSLRWVDLTGGEVTLRPDIVEIARSAARRLPHLFQFHFPTNGTSPAKVEEIAAAVVGMGVPKVVVSISVDGPPDVHDDLRGVPGTWKRAVEAYRRVRGIEGAEAYFGMTLTRATTSAVFACVEALAAHIPGFTARDLHLNIAHSTFYYGCPEVESLDARATADVLSRFMRVRGFPRTPVHLLEMLYQRHVPRYLRTKESPVACQALSSSLFLGPHGEVFPCTTFDATLGSIRDTGYRLDALWRGESCRDLRERILQGRCPGCWTPCEAYQSLIANLAVPSTWAARR